MTDSELGQVGTVVQPPEGVQSAPDRSVDISTDGAVLQLHHHHETIRIEPWGPNAIRVRVAQYGIRDDIPHALVEPLGCVAVARIEPAGGATLTNGALEARVDRFGRIVFVRSRDGEELVSENASHFWWPGPRYFSSTGNTYYRIEQRFTAYADEKIYGLGQRTHGKLDHKGLVLDLVQRNAEVSIPFLLSSRGYGFLWNSPAVGRVEFGESGTRWVADSARQIDYVVIAGESPKDILGTYADLTGHAPELPEWASGFWQSKLRYRTQGDLMAVAREYQRRGLAVAVMVADFFHWSQLGDLRFDEREFPDPQGMIDELAAMGTKLMVSIWPSVSPMSKNYAEMDRRGYLVGTERGIGYLTDWADKGFPKRLPVTFYDTTNPDARAYFWGQAKQNYYDLGIRIWWLDACEPEIRPNDPANMRFAAGLGSEVANLYPRDHAQGFFDGMTAAGESEIVLMCRSAWAGSQRYGAAVWSGDISTTFESLERQVRAGLSIQIAGIPWWTTDIGGFHGGDPDSPEYRELMVRWFQYHGVFCPLFRLHGHREPRGSLHGSTQSADVLGPYGYGGPNEIWSYGEEVYPILEEQLRLRERIRPYVMGLMREAASEGVPPMRALFLEFPDDSESWEVADQFLLGPSVLVAPILALGVRSRSVYLPSGARWRNAWTDEVFDGGQHLDVEAPLERIPVFLRDDAVIPIRG